MKNFNKVKFVYVLLIAVFAFSAFVAPSAKAAPKGNTIVDVALAANAQSGEFSILIAALQAADPAVIQTLSGKGQFTVFAPTDAAFVSLLNELGVTAPQLLSNKDLVTQVLLYHVARGNRDSAEVLASSRIRTLNGGFLFQSGGVLTDANGRTSNIIATDIKASNGVIHVIDRVVLPPANPQPPAGDDDDDSDGSDADESSDADNDDASDSGDAVESSNADDDNAGDAGDTNESSDADDDNKNPCGISSTMYYS